MVTTKASEQSAVFEEGFAQLGVVPHAAGTSTGLSANGCEVFPNELGHVRARQVPPEVLNRVQFRCVRRQVFHGQPRCLALEVGLNLPAAVGRQSIPEEDHFPSTEMAFKGLQIGDDMRLSNRPRVQPQAQPHTTRRRCGDQAGNSRKPLPVERSHQHRCLALGSPGATHYRTFRKPAFIEKNQQRARFARFFLIRGQRYRSQRRTAASFRSRARRSGRWQLQPNSPRTFHT